MANDNTHVIIILDRSGSMQSIREATVNGINDFMDEVRKTPGEGWWSLIQFDDHSSAQGAKEKFPHVVYEHKHDKEVPRLELSDYMPRGSTALIDAVCLTLKNTEELYLAMAEEVRPRVMIVIVTDGLENQSREFSKAKMQEMIARLQSERKWEFTYLGANQDAFAESSNYGIATTSHSFGGVQFCNKVSYEATDEGVLRALSNSAQGVRGWKAEGNKTAENLLSSAAPDDPSKTEEPREESK